MVSRFARSIAGTTATCCFWPQAAIASAEAIITKLFFISFEYIHSTSFCKCSDFIIKNGSFPLPRKRGFRRGLVSRKGAFAHEVASKSLEPGNHPGDHLGREGLLDVFIFRDLAGDAVLEEVVQPPPKVTPPQATFAPQGFCRRFSHLLRSCPSGNVCTPKCRRRTPIDPLWQRNRTKTLPDSTPPITNITPHRQVQRSVRLNRLFFKDIEKAAGHYGREAFTNIFINNWLHNTPQSVAGGRHYDETSILNIQ